MLFHHLLQFGLHQTVCNPTSNISCCDSRLAGQGPVVSSSVNNFALQLLHR